MDTLDFEQFVPSEAADTEAQPTEPQAEPVTSEVTAPTSTLNFDQFIPQETESSTLSLAGRGFVRGLKDAIVGPVQSAVVGTGNEELIGKSGPSTDKELDSVLNKPFSEGYDELSWYIVKALHGFAASSPTLAGAIGGAAIGAGSTIELGPVAIGGGLAGAAAGGGLMSMAQTLGPAYQKGLNENLSPEDAFNRAWVETGIAGASGAVMSAIPAGRASQSAEAPLKEFIFQTFFAQPAVGAGAEIATNAVEGKGTSLDELATSYVTNATLGATLGGTHLLTNRGKNPGVQPVTENGADPAQQSALNPNATTAAPAQAGAIDPAQTTATNAALNPNTAEAGKEAYIVVPPTDANLGRFAGQKVTVDPVQPNNSPKVRIILGDGSKQMVDPSVLKDQIPAPVAEPNAAQAKGAPKKGAPVTSEVTPPAEAASSPEVVPPTLVEPAAPRAPREPMGMQEQIDAFRNGDQNAVLYPEDSYIKRPPERVEGEDIKRVKLPGIGWVDYYAGPELNRAKIIEAAKNNTLDALLDLPPLADATEAQTVPAPAVASEGPQVGGIPAAPPSPEKITPAIVGDVGKGVVDGMYNMLWDKMQKGITTEAGEPSTVLRAARLVYDKGGLQTQEEFRQFAQEISKVSSGIGYSDGVKAVMEKYLPSEADTSVAAPIPETAGPVATGGNDAGAGPTFDRVRTLLPKDAEGNTDYQVLSNIIHDISKGTKSGYNELSTLERFAVVDRLRKASKPASEPAPKPVEAAPAAEEPVTFESNAVPVEALKAPEAPKPTYNVLKQDEILTAAGFTPEEVASMPKKGKLGREQLLKDIRATLGDNNRPGVMERMPVEQRQALIAEKSAAAAEAHRAKMNAPKKLTKAQQIAKDIQDAAAKAEAEKQARLKANEEHVRRITEEANAKAAAQPVGKRVLPSVDEESIQKQVEASTKAQEIQTKNETNLRSVEEKLAAPPEEDAAPEAPKGAKFGEDEVERRKSNNVAADKIASMFEPKRSEQLFNSDDSAGAAARQAIITRAKAMVAQAKGMLEGGTEAIPATLKMGTVEEIQPNDSMLVLKEAKTLIARVKDSPSSEAVRDAVADFYSREWLLRNGQRKSYLETSKVETSVAAEKHMTKVTDEGEENAVEELAADASKMQVEGAPESESDGAAEGSSDGEEGVQNAHAVENVVAEGIDAKRAAEKEAQRIAAEEKAQAEWEARRAATEEVTSEGSSYTEIRQSKPFETASAKRAPKISREAILKARAAAAKATPADNAKAAAEVRRQNATASKDMIDPKSIVSAAKKKKYGGDGNKIERWFEGNQGTLLLRNLLKDDPAVVAKYATDFGFFGDMVDRITQDNLDLLPLRNDFEHMPFGEIERGTAMGILAEMRDALEGVPVYILPDHIVDAAIGKDTAASYMFTEDYIVMRESTLNNASRFIWDLTHEGGHALLFNAVRADPLIRKQLAVIAEHVKNTLMDRLGTAYKEPYGLSNLDEFVSELLSNTKMKATLSTMPMSKEAFERMGIPAPARRVIRTALDAVRYVVSKVMDLPKRFMEQFGKKKSTAPDNPDNALEWSLRIVDRLFDLGPVSRRDILSMSIDERKAWYAAQEANFQKYNKGKGGTSENFNDMSVKIKDNAPNIVENKLLDKVSKENLKDMSEKFRESFVDYNRPMEVEQAKIEELLGPLPEDMKFYERKRLLEGRKIGRQREVAYREKASADAMTKWAKEGGFKDVKELSDTLKARYAETRNAQMRAKNPNSKGTGMDDVTAKALMDAVRNDPAKKQAFDKAAKLNDDLRNEIFDVLKSEDLMTQAEIDHLKKNFKNYTSFQGFADEAIAQAVAEANGTSYSRQQLMVMGDEYRKATGRSTESDDPIHNMYSNLHRAIERAQNVRVTKSMAEAARRAGYAAHDPDSPFFVTTQGNAKVGSMSHAFDDPRIVPFKEGGKTRYLVFKDEGLARSVMQMAPDELGLFLKKADWVTNKIKRVWTHLSPVFLIRHFIFRYPIEAAMNLQAIPGASKNPLTYLKDSFSMLPDVYRHLSGGTAKDPRVARYMKEMYDEGGVVSFGHLSDPDTYKKQLKAIIDNKTETAPKKIWKAWERMLDAADTAERLSAYIRAREAGYTPQKSALMARDITVDFARKGKHSRMLNLWVPFGNVALQTTARMGNNFRSKAYRRTIYAVMAGAAAMNAMNYMVGGNDKDGTPWIEKVPAYERNQNLILMLPWKDSDGKPAMFKVPLPYPLFAINAAGNAVTSMAMKGMGMSKLDTGSIASSVMHGMAETFTPLGHQINSLWQLAVPEVARFTTDIYANENPLGGPIHTSHSKKGMPRSEQGFKTTAWGWKEMAQVMAKAGLDMYPEDVEYITKHFFNSQLGIVSSGGASIPKIVMSSPSDQADLKRFYALADHTDIDADLMQLVKKKMQGKLLSSKEREQVKEIEAHSGMTSRQLVAVHTASSELKKMRGKKDTPLSDKELSRFLSQKMKEFNRLGIIGGIH